MDKTCDKWIKTLKPSTARPYNEGMNRYIKFTGLTPTQLIEQARKDYIDRVPPWKLRSVKSVEDFIQDLKSQGLSNMSMLAYLNGVRNFYAFNRVPLPKLNIKIAAQLTERYKDLELIKLEDVRTFITSCGVDQKLLKALTLSFLSSGQAQAEILSLKGKHLKTVINGVAIVKMTRGKTNTNYMFFLGSEALQAIKEYKPVIGDDVYVFTQEDNTTKLSIPHVDMLYMRHSDKIGYKRGYINPHRFRHYFKTALTGFMDTNFIEYLMGHKLKGVESSYFIGSAIQERMLEAYTKNQDKLTIFTDTEKLQKDYDELKAKNQENEVLKQRLSQVESLLQRWLDNEPPVKDGETEQLLKTK